MKLLADSFLRQLFYNFIDNTRKYGEKTTSIRVHYEMTDQDSLKLIYEDDGIGISLENKPNYSRKALAQVAALVLGYF